MQNIAILASGPMASIAREVASTLAKNEDLKDEGYEYEFIELSTKEFANGEILPQIPESVRSKIVYLFHCPALPDPNRGFMELFLTLNALKLSWTREVVLVLPFMPYFRQDRKDDAERVPISARAIADMVTMTGIVRGVITMDLHVEQEQGFFSCPTQNLSGRAILAPYFRERFAAEILTGLLAVSSTDLGGGKRAQRLANAIDPRISVGTLLKNRNADATVTSLGFIGESIKGKTVILSDDMIDTGNSTITGIKALYEHGAKHVIASASHGIFSTKPDFADPTAKQAETKFRNVGAEVITLDTIPRTGRYLHENADWLKVIPTGDYLAKVICESHRANGSVSALR